MSVMETLTKLVVGMSRFGDHLLSRKISGIIVATFAFACGAGLASALKSELKATPAAPAAISCGDPNRAEVSMSDTPARTVAVEEEEEAVVETCRYKNSVGGRPRLVFLRLALSTPRSQDARDRPGLEDLMKGWCLQPAE